MRYHVRDEENRTTGYRLQRNAGKVETVMAIKLWAVARWKNE
jgi:hypothetical protein